MKQSNRHPLAWCVELNQTVTPYEAYALVLNQLKEELTFQCVECHRPLLLVQHRRGFLNHPLFRRRARENHSYCLPNVYQEHVAEDMKHYLDFEEALFQIVARLKDIKRLFHILEISQEYLRDEKEAFQTKAPSFYHILNLDLNPSYQAFEALEQTIRNLEEGYKTG